LGTNNFLRAVPRPFGAANWVTLGRAAFGAAVLAWAGYALASGNAPGPGLRWAVAAGGAVVLCLDGLDGYLARRLGTASAFGARFDMEADALITLALAAFVWRAGQAGAWVLAAGAMRYIFVLGGWLWPVLALPLPPRRRRQSLCVVQLVALLLALAPPVTPAWGSVICLVGLLLLGYSFGVDVAWLMARPKAESEAVW
jgi:phosphatidylglycerophosphate synthase